MLMDRYDKRRIPKVFDAAVALFGLRRRGRAMTAYLFDLDEKVVEAERYGLTISDELKGVLAVMLAELTPPERTQTLSLMQARADTQSGDLPDFSQVTAILQSLGDSAHLGGAGARTRSALWGTRAPGGARNRPW